MSHPAHFLEILSAGLLSPLACRTYVGLGLFLAVMLVLDVRSGRGVRRYLSAGFGTDLVYTLLIVGGVYGVVQQPLVGWVDSVLRRHAPFLYLDLFRFVPEVAQVVVLVLAVDFARYWKHRWMHTSPLLWAFHSVHHAPREITFLTNYRLHLVDLVMDGVATLVPVVLLGPPAEMWLPVTFLLLWYGSLHHSDLDLSYGWLDRILVSPRFHSVHHSAEPDHFGSNFGAATSLWDTLFGTARFETARPGAYGLGTMEVPASFLGQLVFPFRLLAKRGLRAAAVALRRRPSHRSALK